MTLIKVVKIIDKSIHDDMIKSEVLGFYLGDDTIIFFRI